MRLVFEIYQTLLQQSVREKGVASETTTTSSQTHYHYTTNTQVQLALPQLIHSVLHINTYNMESKLVGVPVVLSNIINIIQIKTLVMIFAVKHLGSL